MCASRQPNTQVVQTSITQVLAQRFMKRSSGTVSRNTQQDHLFFTTSRQLLTVIWFFLCTCNVSAAQQHKQASKQKFIHVAVKQIISK